MNRHQTKTVLLLLLWLGILTLTIAAFVSEEQFYVASERAFEVSEFLFKNATGVITGLLANIFVAILVTVMRRVVERIIFLSRKIQDATFSFKIPLSALFNALIQQFGDQVSEVIVRVNRVVVIVLLYISRVILVFLSILGRLLNISVVQPIVFIIDKINKPKWYHKTNAIDPGLVQVSLAVTAVLVALPSFISPNIYAQQANIFTNFRFLTEAIPTLISISLLDRYAKNKGSKSIHILLSPIDDGPFFFIGWSIVMGLVFIAVITLQIGLPIAGDLD
jgi:hypothetical protein